MKKALEMRNAVTFVIVIVVVVGVLFAAQVILANRAAARDFGPRVCWLKQGSDTVNLRELEFSTTGYFIPNPLTLLNRRFLGLGMEDQAVLSPHFAVLAPSADGTLEIWAWSLRKRAFWRDENGTIDKFASADLRDKCEAMLEDAQETP
ncbi:MAG: hypothetical protein JJ901_03480 [Erythrobacter sp.]|uniref:hypothetical protein n=1 Tax=Erythrobacter sp. TaxID=1042 RepID=UPI001B1E8400|nr:hypothetical protein [Erythrobacter sp.]MBO6767351.1 hypothetical protein [Erythrobacter sp.]